MDSELVFLQTHASFFFFRFDDGWVRSEIKDLAEMGLLSWVRAQ